MSGWKVVVEVLYRHPEESLDLARLFYETNLDNIRGFVSIAERGGYILCVNRDLRGREPIRWKITQKGIDFKEHRLKLVVFPSGMVKRLPERLVCTWLSSLPRHNQVRLTGPATFLEPDFRPEFEAPIPPNPILSAYAAYDPQEASKESARDPLKEEQPCSHALERLPPPSKPSNASHVWRRGIRRL